MKTTIEQLLSDNLKRDEKIRKATSIMENLQSENIKFKEFLKRKDSLIEEHKKQIRELEDSLLKIRSQVREIDKYKAVEHRLRKDLETANKDKLALENTARESKRDYEGQIERLKKEVDHEKILKDKILNDISDIADNERHHSDLMEEYVNRVRELEDMNERLQQELLESQEDRNSLIQQHNKEIKDVKERASASLQRYKDVSQFGGNFQNELQNPQSLGDAGWEARYRLMAEIAADSMKCQDEFSKIIKGITISEKNAIELFTHKMKEQFENELITVQNEDIENEFCKYLDKYDIKVEELESIVSQQQIIIETLSEENERLQLLYTKAVKELQMKALQSFKSQDLLLDDVNQTILLKEKQMVDTSKKFEEEIEFLKQKLSDSEADKRAIFDTLEKEFEEQDIKIDRSLPITESIQVFVLEQKDRINQERIEIEGRTRDILEEQSAREEELKATADDYLERISDLQKEIKKKAAEFEELHVAFEQKLEESESDFTEINLLEERILSLTSECERYQSKITDLSKENNSLISKYEELVCMNMSSITTPQQEASNTELLYENKSLKNNLLNMEFTIKEQQYEIEGLREELEVRKERLIQLVKKQNDIQEENKALRRSLLDSTQGGEPSLYADIDSHINDQHIDVEDDDDLEEFERDLMMTDFD